MPANRDDHGNDHGGDLDVDAVFADIVSHWEQPAPAPTAPEDGAEARAEAPGDAEDTAPEERRPAGELPPARIVRPLPPAPVESDLRRPPAPVVPPGSRPDETDLDSEPEGFVPPEPPPLPRDLVGWAAWAGVLGGPAVLLLATLVRGSVPGIVAALAVAAFVAGFATLVARLPKNRDDEDDDGAVV
ncbi:hypothetical protein NUM3379_18980 [Kineococcus sp. NUM-3379]